MLLTVNFIKMLIFSIPKRQTATSNNILQLAPYQPLNEGDNPLPPCVLRTALFWPCVLRTAIFRSRVLRTF